MFAKIALRTYVAGVGASGLYGLSAAVDDFENKKKTELLEEPDIVKPLLSEFLRYSSACSVGLALGVAFGILWPIALVDKTISTINELDIITKNS